MGRGGGGGAAEHVVAAGFGGQGDGGTGGGGETKLSYSHTWGKGGSESKSLTVGSDAGVSVDLESVGAVLEGVFDDFGFRWKLSRFPHGNESSAEALSHITLAS